MARHLVSSVTRRDGAETVIDGWYIDAPGLPKHGTKSGGSIAVLTIILDGRTPAPPKIEMKQVGPAPEGLPAWLKTTATVALPGGSPHKYESLSEETELYEGARAGKLLEPPDGFQRVTNLPYAASAPAPRTWADVIRAQWQKITELLASLF